MSTLLAAAVLATTALLPAPPLPADPGAQSSAQVQRAGVSGTLDAADGRLRRGCKDYQFRYGVDTPSTDWSFDITIRDRTGKGVNSQALIGPNDPQGAVVTYRLCRGATVPGPFTMTGLRVSYDGMKETSVTVTETFRLRRRNA